MSSIEKAVERLRVGNEAAKAASQAQQPESSGFAVDGAGYAPRHVTDANSMGTATGRHETIDVERLRNLGMVSQNPLDCTTTEEFRQIKRMVLKNCFGSGPGGGARSNLVMVTSAVPGEGKTFTAINLALSIAMELDKTVLLVDADSAMTGVAKTLGFQTGPGLSDVILNPEIPLDEVLIATNIPRLTILSAGQKQQRMTELLASENARRLVQQLSERYADRVIIFDSPPLIVTSEARVLAGLVGQVLIVVEAGKTPQRIVQDAVSHLDRTKAIGFVLNKSRQSTSSAYGYGYGYGVRSDAK